VKEKDKFGRGWVKIDDHVQEIAEETWSMYWNELAPSEALEFLANPKDALVREGLIEEDYRIQTVVVNSEVEAAIPPTCCGILVFPEEKLALITAYRHPR
jgi:hypothetical protein